MKHPGLGNGDSLLGGGEWLAIVQGLQDGQLMGVLLHQVSKLVQDGATLTPSHTGPGAVVKCLSTTTGTNQP